MPFQVLGRPNLALSLLREILLEAGYECEIVYANIDFAEIIGCDFYREIAMKFPHESLVCDLVFSHLIGDRSGGRTIAMSTPDLDISLTPIPESVKSHLDVLRPQATKFIKDLACRIASEHPLLVGVTMMLQTTPSLALLRELERVAPEVLTACGGAMCEADMGHALHETFPYVDFVCRGEGERLLVELVGALSRGEDSFAAIRGLLWRQDGQTVANGNSTETITNLDDWPLPRYDDWLERVGRLDVDRESLELNIPFETSRGCWWGQKSHCTFCGLNGETMQSRSKSPKRALETIRSVRRYGVNALFATDLILPQEYFSSVLPELANDHEDFTMFYEVKSNLNREQIRIMRDSGIMSVQPGIENLSTPVLKLMKKGVTGMQNICLLKWTAEVGIAVDWNFLYGFPGEPEDEYEKMAGIVPLLTHLRPPTFGCRAVRLDRFSPLYERAKVEMPERLQPSENYQHVFDVEPELLNRMAYHFELTGPESVSNEYIQALDNAVLRWRGMVGKSSFTCIEHEEELWLFDRRSGEEIQENRLRGLEQEIYLICSEGVGRRTVHRGVDGSETEVDEILEWFVQRGWVLKWDNRFLSLAVDLTGCLPRRPPKAILGMMCHFYYVSNVSRHWQKQMDSWKFSQDSVPSLPLVHEL